MNWPHDQDPWRQPLCLWQERLATKQHSPFNAAHTLSAFALVWPEPLHKKIYVKQVPWSLYQFPILLLTQFSYFPLWEFGDISPYWWFPLFSSSSSSLFKLCIAYNWNCKEIVLVLTLGNYLIMVIKWSGYCKIIPKTKSRGFFHKSIFTEPEEKYMF